ncbi:hypothetical protein OROMI_003519 [Orobanche minor]
MNYFERGSGKSTPHACLEENTTWDLIYDIEKLRNHLKIPEWLVFGGSWGSTLVLAYSESHPDKVTGMVLRGIFLLRKKEIDWFYEGGAAALFPDDVVALVLLIRAAENRNLAVALVLIIWVVVGRDHQISSSSKPPQETSPRRGDHRPEPVTMTKMESTREKNSDYLNNGPLFLKKASKNRHSQSYRNRIWRLQNILISDPDKSKSGFRIEERVVLLICATKVAKSAFDKALVEHEDIDDAVGSEEPTERDHGVDLQQSLLIKIDFPDSHKK